MDTFFAPPEKAGDRELAAEIQAVGESVVISGLLQSVSGLLAILDEHRQIVALNDSFIKMLGIQDSEQALGLRPGEALQCVHADKAPSGCGTTEFCSTCGAALAIVASLGQDIPCERLCALSARRGNSVVDLVLLVRAKPIRIKSVKFVLLFVQDITKQEQRAALERTFYHDINNMLNMLVQASELLVVQDTSSVAKTIHHSAFRLVKEVAIQRCLSEATAGGYQPMWDEFTIKQIFRELQSFFLHHPSAKGKHIEFSEDYQDTSIKTDICLLLRLLCNMVINALEATEENGAVRIWVEYNTDYVSFCVWNSGQIPQEIVRRIFQRNFSTKAEPGRGVGTYSMKLFGENILGGKVSFSTSEEGTVFRFNHCLSDSTATA